MPMDTTMLVLIMVMAVAVLNIALLARLSSSENKKREEQPDEAEKTEEVSVMGKTKTRIFWEDMEQKPSKASEKQSGNPPEPTEEPEDDSPEIGEEFQPDTDEVDEEEIEMEDLLLAVKEDIRLDSSGLVTREIAKLQKAHGAEDIPEEEQEEIKTVLAKLDGSEFLRVLKENEEKAEKRNKELLRLIAEQENPIPKTEREDAAEMDSGSMSLEDFL